MSIQEQILGRIVAHGRGWCFAPAAFLDIGSPEAVRVSLHRLEKQAIIRRLTRGLYDYPKEHPKIGLLAPSPDLVAQALAQRDATALQPSGAYAANLLGLTEQVPAKAVFLTNGAARTVKIGRQEIVLKRTSPRGMATAGRMSGTIIQALRHIGAANINATHLTRIGKTLGATDKEQLWKDRLYAPAWMRPHLRSILGDFNA